MLYLLSHSSSPLCSGYLGDSVFSFCPGQSGPWSSYFILLQLLGWQECTTMPIFSIEMGFCELFAWAALNCDPPNPQVWATNAQLVSALFLNTLHFNTWNLGTLKPYTNHSTPLSSELRFVTAMGSPCRSAGQWQGAVVTSCQLVSFVGATLLGNVVGSASKLWLLRRQHEPSLG
jgi:hypothetical protein